MKTHCIIIRKKMVYKQRQKQKQINTKVCTVTIFDIPEKKIQKSVQLEFSTFLRNAKL